MRTYVVALLAVIALNCNAAPPEECNMRNFPDFWADAQARVQKLKATMKALEQEKRFPQASASAFRQSLQVCEAKRKVTFGNVPTGNGGVVSQSKCETFLICSRLMAIESDF